MKEFLVIVFITFLCAGCGIIKHQVTKPDIVQWQEEVIARCLDIPDVPFQVQLENIVVDLQNHDQMQIFYKMNLSKEDLIAFYEQQMERLGWQLIAESNLQDCFLCYSKPQKFCCIIIENDSFSVYIGNKKGA